MMPGSGPRNPRPRAGKVRQGQCGAGLVATLAGLLVGLAATIVMLDLFAHAEGARRNAAGVADAQQTGNLALFTLAAAIGNAGNALAANAAALATCVDTGDVATTQRPVPLLIAPGASAGAPDSIVVRYGAPAALAAAMRLALAAPAGAPFAVRSPTGFAAGDALVAIRGDGRCAATVATAVTAPDADGVVEIAHAGLPDAFPAGSLLLDVGPPARGERVRYDVVDAALRSLDLATPGAAPNPLASNIVNLKAQYGVDSDGDGVLDAWVDATAAPWTPAEVLAADPAQLARIKAVRIGLIVKSEVYDRDAAAAYDWVLFDCGDDDKARCPGRLTGRLPAKWRYRSYETLVPLRNAIWNASR